MPRSIFLRVWLLWMSLMVVVGMAKWTDLLLDLPAGSYYMLQTHLDNEWVFGTSASSVFSWFAVPLQAILTYNIATSRKSLLDVRAIKRVVWILFLMSMLAIWIEPRINSNVFTRAFFGPRLYFGSKFMFSFIPAWIIDLPVTVIWFFLHSTLLKKIDKEYSR